jgi:hypothetical protein
MDSELAALPAANGNSGSMARNGFPSQFYPEARDLAGAVKIHLAGGQDTEANLSLTLQPFHTVTAQAILPSGRNYGDQNPAWAGMALTAQVLDAQGHSLPYVAEYDPETRALHALLPDGSYSFSVTVTFSRFTARPRETDSFTPAMDAAPLTGQVEFSVAGHDVANLRIPLLAQHANPLQVTVARSGAQPASGTLLRGNRARSIVALSQAGDSLSNGMVSLYADGAAPGQLETTFTRPAPIGRIPASRSMAFAWHRSPPAAPTWPVNPWSIGPAGVTAPLTWLCATIAAALRSPCPRPAPLRPPEKSAGTPSMWFQTSNLPKTPCRKRCAPPREEPSLWKASRRAAITSTPSPRPWSWNTTTPPRWPPCPRRDRPSPSPPEPPATSSWRCPRNEQNRIAPGTFCAMTLLLASRQRNRLQRPHPSTASPARW